ncbi:MAG TPA: hypothetical protein VI172_00840 [Candidatus Dormibacteraeota bacterium]|jgi:hypothetical protein
MNNNWNDVEGADPKTKILKVPGGWLYMVAHSYWVDPYSGQYGHWVNGWHTPVFVPEAAP